MPRETLLRARENYTRLIIRDGMPEYEGHRGMEILKYIFAVKNPAIIRVIRKRLLDAINSAGDISLRE